MELILLVVLLVTTGKRDLSNMLLANSMLEQPHPVTIRFQISRRDRGFQ